MSERDIRWMTAGGILIDGNGDIQLTDPEVPESLVDMILTRLKADVNSWKLYRIGANLSRLVGEIVDPELELKIKRQISDSMTRDGLLAKGSFSVETIPSPAEVLAILYLAGEAVATVAVPRVEGGEIRVE